MIVGLLASFGVGFAVVGVLLMTDDSSGFLAGDRMGFAGVVTLVSIRAGFARRDDVPSKESTVLLVVEREVVLGVTFVAAVDGGKTMLSLAARSLFTVAFDLPGPYSMPLAFR